MLVEKRDFFRRFELPKVKSEPFAKTYWVAAIVMGGTDPLESWG